MFDEIEEFVRNAQWQEAVDACRMLLVAHPENARAHAYLGLSLYRMDSLEEAVVELQRATYLDPQHIDAGIKLAQALNRLRRHKEALIVAIEYLHLRPGDHTLQALVDLLSDMPDAVEHDAWERTANLEIVQIEHVED